MTAVIYWNIVVSFIFIAGCGCSRVKPLHNDTLKYVCTGSPAILPWTVELDPGDSIQDIEWLFKSNTTEKMIAFSTLGNFLPTLSLTNRVRGLPSAGIALKNVTSGDTGSYVVVVKVRNSNGTKFTLEGMVALVVIDSVLTSKQLEVRQLDHAAYNTDTQEWELDLTCGHFIYTGRTPQLQVEWTDPTGQTLPSSFYNNGLFHLLVPNPAQDGNYTCRVPRDLVTCHQGMMEGRVEVEAVAGRVVVAEAVQRELKDQTGRLRNTTSSLVEENRQLGTILSGLEKEQQTLTQQQDSLKQTLNASQHRTNSSTQILADLLSRVQDLQNGPTQNLPNTQTSQTTTTSPDLHGLETKLTQLNQSVTQCCREQAELLQNNSLLRQQSAQLSRDWESLVLRVNQRVDGRSQDLENLNESVIEMRQQGLGLRGRLQSLGLLVNKTAEASGVVSQRLEDLENDVTSGGRGAPSGGGDLRLRLENVEKEFNALSARRSKAYVSFQARMDIPDDYYVILNDSQPVLFSKVVNSHGGTTDDPTTSIFTAPANGTYFFAVSFSAKDRTNSAQVALMTDGQEVGYGATSTIRHYESGLVHSIVELRQGQTVWVKNHGHSVYYPGIGSFSGVLLHTRI